MLRKGHLGYNLYFIYSGAVSVVLDKDEGNIFVKPEVVVLRKGACFGVSTLFLIWKYGTAFAVVEREETYAGSTFGTKVLEKRSLVVVVVFGFAAGNLNIKTRSIFC